MKKLVYFLFGKPYREDKAFLFIYWIIPIFYFIAMIQQFILCIHTGGFLNFLISLILFPIAVRIVLGFNALFYNKFRK